MDDEVLNRLVVAQIYLRTAWVAGSARHAIADGYLALDNALSALIIDSHQKPSFNHKAKIEQAFKYVPDLFTNLGVTEETLGHYLIDWQNVRYSGLVPARHEAFERLRLSERVIAVILRHVAVQNDLSVEDMETQVDERAFGAASSIVYDALGDIHEMLQNELEIDGDLHGAKLGKKLANPSNFADALVLASDQLSQKIVAGDETAARRIAELYYRFLNVIQYIQIQRFADGIPMEEVMNFSLSLRFSFDGRSFKEIADDFQALVAEMEKQTSARSAGLEPSTDNDE